jgi:hypothetical protein
MDTTRTQLLKRLAKWLILATVAALLARLYINQNRRLGEMERAVKSLKNSKRNDDTALLNVASQKTYGLLKSRGGDFLVSLVKAEPYLNGYKLELAIGNINCATYQNYSLTLEYGQKKATNVQTEDWEKTLRTTSAKPGNLLRPAVWTSSEIIVSPAQASDLDFLRLSLDTGQVSLNQPEN